MKSEDLMEAWNRMNVLVDEMSTIGGKEARESHKRKIGIAQLEFESLFKKASASDAILFIGELLTPMKEDAINRARRKINTWRETSRLLGEADAFDEIEKLIDQIYWSGNGELDAYLEHEK